jgi:hypothetical protein
LLNSQTDRSIFANHLALQGFAMKRAILQLEELIIVLAIGPDQPSEECPMFKKFSALTVT